MSIPRSFLRALENEELEPSDRQLELLELFLGRLLEANRSFNLTAIRDADEAWRKHVLESLALTRSLRGAATVADLGSGGGLPGIPLAVMLPDARFTLIEATGKKAAFLGDTATALELGNVRVLPLRAEEAGRDAELRESFDAVVARAVGTLSELIELAMPLLCVGGRLLAVKGRGGAAEVGSAARALDLLAGDVQPLESLLRGGAGESRVATVVKRGPTPEKYPRRAGVPKKRPL